MCGVAHADRSSGRTPTTLGIKPLVPVSILAVRARAERPFGSAYIHNEFSRRPSDDPHFWLRRAPRTPRSDHGELGPTPRLWALHIHTGRPFNAKPGTKHPRPPPQHTFPTGAPGLHLWPCVPIATAGGKTAARRRGFADVRSMRYARATEGCRLVKFSV